MRAAERLCCEWEADERHGRSEEVLDRGRARLAAKRAVRDSKRAAAKALVRDDGVEVPRARTKRRGAPPRPVPFVNSGSAAGASDDSVAVGLGDALLASVPDEDYTSPKSSGPGGSDSGTDGDDTSSGDDATRGDPRTRTPPLIDDELEKEEAEEHAGLGLAIDAASGHDALPGPRERERRVGGASFVRAAGDFAIAEAEAGPAQAEAPHDGAGSARAAMCGHAEAHAFETPSHGAVAAGTDNSEALVALTGINFAAAASPLDTTPPPAEPPPPPGVSERDAVLGLFAAKRAQIAAGWWTRAAAAEAVPPLLSAPGPGDAAARPPPPTIVVDPLLQGEWEGATRGVGSRLLARMGYRGGALGGGSSRRGPPPAGTVVEVPLTAAAAAAVMLVAAQPMPPPVSSERRQDRLGLGGAPGP